MTKHEKESRFHHLGVSFIILLLLVQLVSPPVELGVYLFAQNTTFY